MKEAIYADEIEIVGKVWSGIKKSIEGFLMKRGATITDQYNKNLSDEQFKRLQVEEEFVKKIADFMNDCQGYVNVHRKQIQDLEFTIGMLRRGHETDMSILKDVAEENSRIYKVLNELLAKGENKVLIEIFKNL